MQFKVRNQQLDQIRGVAILSVVLLHWHTQQFPGGSVGVGIFFCLSGYLITSFLMQPPRFNLKVALQFIIRRLARIYPAFVCAVAANLIILWYFEPALFETSRGYLLNTLAFIKLPPVHTMGFGVLWTLLVEVRFYLTLPLVMLVLGRPWGVVSYCLVVIGLRDWGAVIAVGSLLSVFTHSDAFNKLRLPRGVPTLAALLVTIAMVLTPAPTGDVIFWRDMIVAVFTAGAVMDVLKWPNLPVVPLLPQLGLISYSTYLVHALVLDVLNHVHVHPFKGFGTLAFFGTTLAISAISWAVIERPGISAGRFLSKAVIPNATQSP